MGPIELYRNAVAEIGDVSTDELSAHIEKKHGVKIEPPFIPLFRATLQQMERTARLCQEAKPISPKKPSQTT